MQNKEEGVAQIAGGDMPQVDNIGPELGGTLDQPRERGFVSLEVQLTGASAELSRGELCIRYEVGQDRSKAPNFELIL